MSDDLPPGIQIETLPDGVCYRFPKPNVGIVGIAGMLVFALAALAVGVAAGWAALSAWKDPSSSDIVPTILIACMSACFLFSGYGFAYLTAVALVNPAFKIEVRGNELRAVFRSGPFHRVRRRPVRSVERIVIDKVDLDRSATDEDRVAASTFGTLYAEGHNIRRLCLVPSYLFIGPNMRPRIWLRPLAQDLAGAIDRHAAEYAIISRRERGVEVEEKDAPRPVLAGELDGEDAVTPPASTDATVQKSPDRTEVRVPVPRLRSLRSVRCTVFWIGMISGLLVFLSGLMLIHASPLWGPWFFGLLLVLGLAYCAYYALHLLAKARTSVEFELADDILTAHRSSMRGSRTWRWVRGQIVAIWVKPVDRMTSIFELSIICEADVVHLLRGRDLGELQWIAAILRDALGLSRRSDDEAQ